MLFIVTDIDSSCWYYILIFISRNFNGQGYLKCPLRFLLWLSFAWFNYYFSGFQSIKGIRWQEENYFHQIMLICLFHIIITFLRSSTFLEQLGSKLSKHLWAFHQFILWLFEVSILQKKSSETYPVYRWWIQETVRSFLEKILVCLPVKYSYKWFDLQNYRKQVPKQFN